MMVGRMEGDGGEMVYDEIFKHMKMKPSLANELGGERPGLRSRGVGFWSIDLNRDDECDDGWKDGETGEEMDYDAIFERMRASHANELGGESPRLGSRDVLSTYLYGGGKIMAVAGGKRERETEQRERGPDDEKSRGGKERVWGRGEEEEEGGGGGDLYLRGGGQDPLG
ncbi:hypothetical protein N656DRAFT_49344 [Canariomyces notabilis]|uniref:Uncharacterized protein n=1 Tax=Canariomyces notabilis TaxID=2074819 RepID=A0AAN6TN99_9PEZI|nr:hypothetical protein N656DRAFT_49344 [Canariomyces arenarius]